MGYLKQENREFQNAFCPKILGIDDKNFSRKLGFMTAFADLKRHRLYDEQLGRSDSSLRRFLKKIPIKQNCKVVLIGLSEAYRSIAKNYFINAMIVADRLHVIRLINHHFLKVWGLIVEVGRKNRGLLSLIRRHPWNLKLDQEEIVRMWRFKKTNSIVEGMYTRMEDLIRRA